MQDGRSRYFGARLHGPPRPANAIQLRQRDIGDNVLSDVQTNIHLVGVRGVTVSGNTLWQGYAHNMLIEDSHHVLVGPNMLERNPLYSYTTEGKCDVVLRGCSGCTIQGLHLHNVLVSEAGLTLDKCDLMHVFGCTILDCPNIGLLLKECTRCRVHENMIYDSQPNPSLEPIVVRGGRDNDVGEP